MRISDWSSDVCSSDLHADGAACGRVLDAEDPVAHGGRLGIGDAGGDEARHQLAVQRRPGQEAPEFLMGGETGKGRFIRTAEAAQDKAGGIELREMVEDRKSTRLNSSH